MYKAILSKINYLQERVKTADDYNKPNLILVDKENDNQYKIVEWYYNTLNHKNTKKEYLTDDYKKALEKYTSEKVRVIINDLPRDNISDLTKPTIINIKVVD